MANTFAADPNDGQKQVGSIYLSIADAVRATGLGRTTIYQLVSNGVIESFTIGRRRLIVAESLQRLHEQRSR